MWFEMNDCMVTGIAFGTVSLRDSTVSPTKKDSKNQPRLLTIFFTFFVHGYSFHLLQSEFISVGSGYLCITSQSQNDAWWYVKCDSSCDSSDVNFHNSYNCKL